MIKATEGLFRTGEVRTVRADAFMSDSGLGQEQQCTVVSMEHRYGRNRFVLVELHDENRTQVLVYPENLV